MTSGSSTDKERLMLEFPQRLPMYLKGSLSQFLPPPLKLLLTQTLEQTEAGRCSDQPLTNASFMEDLSLLL